MHASVMQSCSVVQEWQAIVAKHTTNQCIITSGIVTKFAYLLFPKHEQVINVSLKECSTIDPLIGGSVDKEPSPVLLYVFIEPCIEGFVLCVCVWGGGGRGE